MKIDPQVLRDWCLRLRRAESEFNRSALREVSFELEQEYIRGIQEEALEETAPNGLRSLQDAIEEACVEAGCSGMPGPDAIRELHARLTK